MVVNESSLAILTCFQKGDEVYRPIIFIAHSLGGILVKQVGDLVYFQNITSTKSIFRHLLILATAMSDIMSTSVLF